MDIYTFHFVCLVCRMSSILSYFHIARAGQWDRLGSDKSEHHMGVLTGLPKIRAVFPCQVLYYAAVDTE